MPAADVYLVDNDTVGFQNLPVPNTMLYIYWGGDGSSQRVTAGLGTATAEIDHTFAASARYDRGDYYEYQVRAYVYNGRSRVDTKQEYVRIYK